MTGVVVVVVGVGDNLSRGESDSRTTVLVCVTGATFLGDKSPVTSYRQVVVVNIIVVLTGPVLCRPHINKLSRLGKHRQTFFRPATSAERTRRRGVQSVTW